NFDGIYRRQPGWIYKLVLVISLIATTIIGLAEGRNWQDPSSASIWIYDHLFSPMSATMFALLAFFIASAAFRAFRIRTVEAGLLAAAALIVMLGRVPIGDRLTAWLPHAFQLGTLQQWIMDFPQSASKRAILIGAALG